MNGNWLFDETCKQANCANVPCHSAVITQSPDSPDDVWYASNSSTDAGFDRAEYIGLDSVSTVTVWGFKAYFDGSQWSSCDTDMEFSIRSYSDAGGLPGKLLHEQLNTVPNAIATGILYAGLYELIQFELEFVDTNVEHLSIQAETEDLDCWFLWMSSSEGDGSSALNTGGNWSVEIIDLSICIE